MHDSYVLEIFGIYIPWLLFDKYAPTICVGQWMEIDESPGRSYRGFDWGDVRRPISTERLNKQWMHMGTRSPVSQDMRCRTDIFTLLLIQGHNTTYLLWHTMFHICHSIMLYVILYICIYICVYINQYMGIRDFHPHCANYIMLYTIHYAWQKDKTFENTNKYKTIWLVAL